MSRQQQLEHLVRAHFEVESMLLLNESDRHSVPEHSETHFKLTLVSPDFAGLSAVQRHQRVYALARPLLAQGLHALTLHLFTPEEWSQRNGSVQPSPACMGGSKATQ
jgi:BolA protein